MRVRFLETVVYETEGPGKGPVFDAGSIHDLRDDIAQRWIRRSKAELVVDEITESKRGRPKLSLTAQGDQT